MTPVEPTWDNAIMSDLPPPRIEGRFKLPDGRHIGFAEYGPARGDPILWFHGTPGARRQIPPGTRRAAFDHGVRLVVLERPGIGGSTPHAYERVLDWAADVEVLTEALGIDRFGVMALSGGGPYALATAHHLAGRVVAAGIIGGVCPAVGPDATTGGLVNRFRALAPVIDRTYLPLGAALSALVYGLRVGPLADLAFDAYIAISPEGDKRVFARPEMRAMFKDDLLRASRRGVLSLVLDLRLFLRDWGFSLADVRVPVRWWHGDADHMVPLAHAEHTVARLADARLVVRHDESHLGGLDAASEIIDEILALWPEHVEPSVPAALPLRPA
jgi:pimeloyl-ACP methyl ester carboxylesterase